MPQHERTVYPVEIAPRRPLAREADLIAEADADIEAGRMIDSDAVDAWIESIGTDEELPPPRVGG